MPDFLVAISENGSQRSGEPATTLLARLRDAGQPWRGLLSERGVCVLCRGYSPLFTETLTREHNDHAKVLLGMAFKGERPVCSTENRVPECLENITPGNVIDTLWGNYIALFVDWAKNTITLLRSPMSTLPCFYARQRDVIYLYSDFNLSPTLLEDDVRVDHDELLSRFFSVGVPTGRTGLADVKELAAGSQIRIRQSRVAEMPMIENRWSFNELAAAAADQTFSDAAARTGSAVDSVINAYESLMATPLLQLSGGFDSTVLLSAFCKNAYRNRLTCVNYFYPDSEASDERRFARLVAKHFGVDLDELPIATNVNLSETFGRAPLRPVPSGEIFSMGVSDQLISIGQERGADYRVTGEGGDQLFCQMPSVLPAIDYAATHTPGHDWFSAAFDATRLEGVSVWHVLFRMLWDGRIRKKPTRPISPPVTILHDTFVSGDVYRERAFEADIPWFESFSRLPPGKAAQVQSLALGFAQVSLTAHQQDLPVFYPLLSQPVVEACLGIPTYLSVQGGVTRAAAKAAFSDRIPAEIINRRTKGATHAFFSDTLERSWPFVKDRLMNGRLVSEGLLKHSAMETTLDQKEILRGESMRMLIRLLDTEAWLDKLNSAFRVTTPR